MAKRSGFAGVTKLRKTLRRIEPESKRGIVDEIQKGAHKIFSDAVANLQPHRDTGALMEQMTIKWGRDGLTAVIGPGARHVKINKNPFDTTLYKSNPSKRAAMAFFKGYWLEFGTKGSENIPAQLPSPFLNPAYDSHKMGIVRGVQREVGQTLKQVAQGGPNDFT